jgi:hypothetical protein
LTIASTAVADCATASAVTVLVGWVSFIQPVKAIAAARAKVEIFVILFIVKVF